MGKKQKKDTQQEVKNVEAPQVVSNEEVEKTSSFLCSSDLTYEEKEWVKYLKDRNITATDFLKLNPNFRAKEIIKKMVLYGI